MSQVHSNCVYFILFYFSPGYFTQRGDGGVIYNNGHCIEKEEEIVIEDGWGQAIKGIEKDFSY